MQALTASELRIAVSASADQILAALPNLNSNASSDLNIGIHDSRRGYQ